jgi:hypothetical protein
MIVEIVDGGHGIRWRGGWMDGWVGDSREDEAVCG